MIVPDEGVQQIRREFHGWIIFDALVCIFFTFLRPFQMGFDQVFSFDVIS